MKIGLEADGEGNAEDANDTELGLDEVQIVGRSPADAKGLATDKTEFSNRGST